MIRLRRLMLKGKISLDIHENSFPCELIIVCFSVQTPDKLTVFIKFSIYNTKEG